MSDSAAVILINPKSSYNAGAAIRACSIFGARSMFWTGDRIDHDLARRKSGANWQRHRLPREERMKDYANVNWKQVPDNHLIDSFVEAGMTPVAVEVLDSSELLDQFEHPAHAVYVFGPEDGSLPKGIRTVCHRFVRIPTAHRTPLNLAAAVNVVLYDRFIKEGRCTPLSMS